MNFQTEHGTWPKRPPEIDFDGCPGKVYVRKNIHQETITMEGEETTEWVCETALMTMEEFGIYSQAQTLENQRAMDETLADILLNQVEV